MALISNEGGVGVLTCGGLTVNGSSVPDTSNFATPQFANRTINNAGTGALRKLDQIATHQYCTAALRSKPTMDAAFYDRPAAGPLPQLSSRVRSKRLRVSAVLLACGLVSSAGLGGCGTNVATPLPDPAARSTVAEGTTKPKTAAEQKQAIDDLIAKREAQKQP